MKSNRYIIAFSGVILHLMLGSTYAWRKSVHDKSAVGFLTYFISLESRYGEDLLLVVPAFVDGNVQPQSGKKVLD